MGVIKTEILEEFENRFSELSKIELSLNQKTISFKEREKVLPYLAFTNSLDAHNRIIKIIHSKQSIHHKVLPFYIATAICKREISRFESNIKPITDKLVINYNGNESSVISIDIKTKEINLSNGSKTFNLPFEEFLSPFIKPYSNKYLEAYNKTRDLVQKNKLIGDSRIKNILETPSYLDQQPESGLIIFTPKVKFKELFTSLSINNKILRDVLPTINAKYDTKKNRYRYDWISNNSEDSYPLIVFTNYLDIHAIGEFKKRYPYLDTIVFDEVENNTEAIFEVLPSLENKLGLENGIRDIYLSISDDEIFLSDKIDKYVSESYCWLASDFDFKVQESFNFVVDQTTENNFNRNFEEIFEARYKFRRLFKQFDPSDVYSLYKSFCEIIVRYNSYYDPNDFNQTLLKFENDFDEFINRKLSQTSELYGNFISIIKECIRALKKSLHNTKVASLEKHLSNISPQNKVRIISRNTNERDQAYINSYLKKFELSVNFSDFNDLKDGFPKDTSEAIFLFEIRSPLSNSLFFNSYCKNQILILNNKEVGFFNYVKRNVFKLSDKLTSYENRKNILNFSNETASEFISKSRMSEAVKIRYINTNSSEKPATEEKELSKNLNDDFNDLLIEAYTEQNTYSKSSNHKSNNILVIYKDGTSELLSTKARFYHLTDNKIKDLKDLLVSANDLKPNMDVLSTNTPEIDLEEIFKRKISESKVLKQKYDNSEQWRNSVISLCDNIGFEKATSLISRFIPRNEATIKNWYNNKTQVPQSIRKLINGLNTIAENHPNTQVRKIINPDQVARNAKEIKRLFLQLPKLLLNISIRKLYGLESNSNYDKEIEILANRIFDNVEIKTVNIVKKL